MNTGFDGLVSGLDTSAIVDALLEVYKGPMVKMQEKVDTQEDLQTHLSEFMGLLGDLQTTVEALDSENDFWAVKAASSQDAVSVDAGAGAIAGSHTVEVAQLATSHSVISVTGFAARDTGVIQGGTYTLTYGDDEVDTIEINSLNDTLDEFVAAINEKATGVTAYVLDNGVTDDPERYKVVLAGHDTGAANTVSLALTTPGLPVGTTPTFEDLVAAQDAEISLDGATIHSASNTLINVMPGVTLTLTDETTTAARVTITTDTTTMTDRIQDFVDAYNEVMDYLSVQTVYDADANIRGAFVGESSVRAVGLGIQWAIAGQYGTDALYSSLSSIGITTNYEDGTLEFDTTTFLEALNDDPSAVSGLFTNTESMSASLLAQLDVYLDTETGTLVQRSDTIEETIERYNENIADFQDRVDAYEERLYEQFTNMEIILSGLQTTQTTLDYLFPSNTSDDT